MNLDIYIGFVGGICFFDIDILLDFVIVVLLFSLLEKFVILRDVCFMGEVSFVGEIRLVSGGVLRV